MTDTHASHTVASPSEASDSLRASEARYRGLFSSISHGFCVVEVYFDPVGRADDYRFLEVNPAFEHQSRLRNCLGRRMREVAPDQEPIWRDLYGSVAKTGQTARFQQHGGRPERWYDVQAFPIGETAPYHVGVLFENITAQKEAEATADRLRADLERNAAQLAQLNQDLQLGAAHLSEANRELESFSYSVSHDLRAPLRHIQGYVEMLGRAAGDQLSPKAQRYLNTIGEASSEMGRLIDDLLAFSRMARAEIQQSRVDLNVLVPSVMKTFEGGADAPDVEWSVAALPAVIGDPSLLRQVFVNLLGNAVKYSRVRHPARVDVGLGGHEGDRVVLFVRDNGVGFDPQYTHKLFGVFQRLHRAEEFEGTGIGLATVQRVVARHGGRVWAESMPDKGATFYLTLQMAPPGSQEAVA